MVMTDMLHPFYHQIWCILYIILITTVKGGQVARRATWQSPPTLTIHCYAIERHHTDIFHFSRNVEDVRMALARPFL